MSNRDPLYGESSMDDTWDATRDDMGIDLTATSNDSSQSAADAATGMMEQGKQKAGEMADMAHTRADQGMDKAASAMDKGAEMLRERGEQQGGTMAQVAGTAADAMESAGSYLHNTDTGEMMDQLEAYIRQNPTQSLLIAAGVGFVLAKAFR